MEAKELMIGDLVQWGDVIGRVTRIDIDNNIDIEDVVYEHEYSCVRGIDPIPLTEKILNDNGFNEDKESGQFSVIYDNCKFKDYVIVYIFDDGDCEVECKHHINDDRKNQTIAFVKYVHQLQHILHDCGLNELAENFHLKYEE